MSPEERANKLRAQVFGDGRAATDLTSTELYIANVTLTAYRQAVEFIATEIADSSKPPTPVSSFPQPDEALRSIEELAQCTQRAIAQKLSEAEAELARAKSAVASLQKSLRHSEQVLGNGSIVRSAITLDDLPTTWDEPEEVES